MQHPVTPPIFNPLYINELPDKSQTRPVRSNLVKPALAAGFAFYASQKEQQPYRSPASLCLFVHASVFNL